MSRVGLVVALMVAATSVAFGKGPKVERSFALKTALALELTDAKEGPLRDVKRSELPAQLQGMPDPEVENAIRDAFQLGDAAAAMGRAGSALPGVSFDAIAGMSAFLFLFGPDKREHPAATRHFVAFIPKSFGDEDAATAHLKSVMEESLLSAYRQFGYEISYTERKVEGLIGKPRVDRYIFLKGGDTCGKVHNCVLGITVSTLPQEVDKAPSFVPKDKDGYWAWKNWKWGDKGYGDGRKLFAVVSATELDDPTTFIKGLMLQIPREILIAASARMPEWMAIYEPADEKVRYPAFIHRGEEKLFIEPLPANVVAAAPTAPAVPVAPAAVKVAAAPTLAAGAVVAAKAGATLRGNPTVSGVVLQSLDGGAQVELRSRMTNSFGAWWSVTVGGKTGWLAEADLIPS
jgi:hypothetical protein